MPDVYLACRVSSGCGRSLPLTPQLPNTLLVPASLRSESYRSSSPKSNNILHIIAAKLGPVRASPRGGHPSIMILLDLDLPVLYT